MSLIATRPTLYERLPELYRERDLAQVPPNQLRALVDAIDAVLQALAARVGAQYDDLFIETCEDWVVPYLADLVGSSHLSGDPRTLRADVARTVRHRRRKGTLGAVESQVYALSQWAVHAVELRERLAWNMPLNHLRPDAGGAPPWRTRPHDDLRTPVRGGTAALRSPAWLSFLGGPFDRFAHTVDLKPPLRMTEPPVGRNAPSLPHLGVFLWRLADYQTPGSRPAPPRAPWNQIEPVAAAPGSADIADFAVRFELHPMAEPMRLFDTHRFHADDDPPDLARPGAVPGPMPAARLTTGAPAAQPEAHVRVETYAGTQPPQPADDAPGLVLHLPEVPFAGVEWPLRRGANLCAWELGLRPPLRPFEVVVDPVHGRVVFGVGGSTPADFAEPLAQGLRVSATTGFTGTRQRGGGVGAQPLPRAFEPLPAGATLVQVDGSTVTLADALANLPDRTGPLVVEIVNSDTHTLDLAAVAGVLDPAGAPALGLPPPPGDGGGRPWTLTLRAAGGQRPVLRLVQPLRWRPTVITGVPQSAFSQFNVRLQGLYLTRAPGFAAGAALIEQAVLNRLQIEECTLDPGGALLLDGSAAGGRAPLHPALRLTADRGLEDTEQEAFGQTPEIVLRHCIAGRLAIDRAYLVGLENSIVDGGAGVQETAPALALGAATGDAETQWGAPVAFDGLTVFGRVRTERARGEGAVFVHRLEVHDNQDSHSGPLFAQRGRRGEEDVLALFARPGSCIRHSWFRGAGDRLPQHFACVFGSQGARLRFSDERFGQPGYAQLALDSDRRIREEGPDADEMGAFGFLRNTHRWKNISIRLREFAPVGVRVLLIPVT
ncbi:phage tail protein [Azohydromonas caseinilytica]|uniref:Phage tail protein (Tail_P2_I) n=1 Tax=Azohydromonas caseinilytica TaxID=2728836 RepID=A0A848FBD9_9BURK|nr:phage tail protein [Azohydromonas caseinilytica]NML16834.1 hypothetical protein [Azohydromonas caseinilytica]